MSPDPNPKKARRGASKEGIRALLGSGSPGPEAGEGAEAVGSEVDEIVERAVEEAIRSPRVTVHSPLVSAVMRYLKMSEGLSISTVLREVLEDAIKERYPKEAELVGKALLARKERELKRRLGIE